MANDTINLLHEYLDYTIAPPMEKRVIFQRTLKLLKAKEQMKGQEEKKESVLGAIKKYQAEDKQKPKESKEKRKETER